jgi:hypothetical protein
MGQNGQLRDISTNELFWMADWLRKAALKIWHGCYQIPLRGDLCLVEGASQSVVLVAMGILHVHMSHLEDDSVEHGT